MGSRSKAKNGAAHVTTPGRRYGYDKAKVRAARPIKFTAALEDIVRPKTASYLIDDLEGFARNARNRRKVGRKKAAPVLARPRTKPEPRPRVARRAAARAAKKVEASR